MIFQPFSIFFANNSETVAFFGSLFIPCEVAMKACLESSHGRKQLLIFADEKRVFKSSVTILYYIFTFFADNSKTISFFGNLFISFERAWKVILHRDASNSQFLLMKDSFFSRVLRF